MSTYRNLTTHRVSTSLDASLYEALLRLAQARGMTISAYVRWRLSLDNPSNASDPADIAAVVVPLGGLTVGL